MNKTSAFCLPNELWDNCWSYCPTRRLCRVALVCRQFHALCQPHLFSNQTFQAPNADTITPQNWTHLQDHITYDIACLDNIARTPHLADEVRRLHFAGSFELDQSWKYPDAMGMEHLDDAYLSAVQSFQRSLSKYRRLRVLFLSNLTIDDAFWQALCALPKLVDLTLEDCDITYRVATAPLRLSRLVVSGVLSEQTGTAFPLDIVALAALRSLSLDGTDTSSVLTAFASRQIFPGLVTLQISLTLEMAPRFFTLLQHCSRLEELIVLSAPHSMTQNLHPSAIPLLKSFSGPKFMACTVVCGRPVTAVELCYANEGPGGHVIAVLERIAQNSTPLVSLGIRPVRAGLRVLTAVHRLFPELTKLSIEFVDSERGYYLPNFSTPGLGIEEEDLCDRCDDDSVDSEGGEEEEDSVPSDPVFKETMNSFM
ncbi:hypothetical protein C8R46DRAFT_1111760 [Mycena filopes]|nr:hypothetical protein C8R46DRAFT_1111760 [Mycena filopes]